MSSNYILNKSLNIKNIIIKLNKKNETKLMIKTN